MRCEYICRRNEMETFMTNKDAKKCYWSYDSMRQVALAYAGLLVDNGEITLEEAKKIMKFTREFQLILAGDKLTSRKLQKQGKEAEEAAFKGKK